MFNENHQLVIVFFGELLLLFFIYAVITNFFGSEATFVFLFESSKTTPELQPWLTTWRRLCTVTKHHHHNSYGRTKQPIIHRRLRIMGAMRIADRIQQITLFRDHSDVALLKTYIRSIAIDLQLLWQKTCTVFHLRLIII